MMINLFDPVVQFCISFVTMNVAEIGLKRLVASWNSHPSEGQRRSAKKAIKIIVIIIIIITIIIILKNRLYPSS